MIDASATDAQVAALTAMLKQQSGSTLGTIVSVKRGAITFTHDKEGYAVNAAGFAHAKVQAMPDDACCKQPSDVWYEPLTKLEGRKVEIVVASVDDDLLNQRLQFERHVIVGVAQRNADRRQRRG